MTDQKSRRHRRLERPRERVMQEAWALLVERGLADLSLSELGRRLDTSAGHLSYYFGSKSGLLLELLRWSEHELAEQRDLVLESGGSAEERLHSLCMLNFPRAAGDPRWLLWVELWPRVMHEPALREAQLEFDAAWREAIARILGELTDDTETLTQRVVALMDGLSVALLTGDTTLTVEQAWQHVKALLPSASRDTQRPAKR
ncbi:MULTISPECIES: TetR/AcrR family transcriptional regulator [Streptomyces]|uniref:AcrR family transcriptional regulator n=1 Tax=Streptomyces stelliscabiei TaxID=146820 RepID=A0A8I0NVD2_9ACTN|nr:MULTISPECIES: TetR/AcrR family transcriptional regulator [Streptomyces]MBE1594281.1 AcrR family transcriptional regulator [Streptomyces stelliscabiei]MDX2521219.1 TetR/AcrR family transcriptional regulator [Streptomyces stelliscabiei]